MKDRKTLIVLLIVLGSLNIATFREGHPRQGDFAQYLIQTKGIVDGNLDKYIDMSYFRKQHSIGRSEPAIYPWGFPILLAPAYALWGKNFFILKVYLQVFFLVSFVYIYLLFKERLENIFVFSIIILISLSPYFFWFKNSILSDIPHLMFTLISLFLIDRIELQNKYLYNKFLSYLILGFILFLAYFTRKQGLILIMLLLTVQTIRIISQKSDCNSMLRSILTASIPTITFIIFFFFDRIILFSTGQSDYADHFDFQRALENIIPNLEYYLTLPVKIIQTSYPPLPLPIILIVETIYLLFLATIVIGIVRKSRQDLLFALFILFYTVFFIAYPYQQGLRFLIPVIPFGLYFFYHGLVNIAALPVFQKLTLPDYPLYLVKKTNSIILVMACLGFIIMSAILFANRESDKDALYGSLSLEIYRFIADFTEEDAIIVHSEPRILMLETNRYAVFIDSLNTDNYQVGDYFVNENQNSRPIDPKLLLRLDKVFYNEGYTIYKKRDSNQSIKMVQ